MPGVQGGRQTTLTQWQGHWLNNQRSPPGALASLTAERLWRSVKYEEVYLRAYACISEARNPIGRYLGF